MKVNPLPNHGNQTMNPIMEEVGTKVVRLVEDVKTLW